MNLVLSIVAQLLHLVVVLLAVPCVLGLSHWLEARLQGRYGAQVLQPWHDLIRLTRKDMVLPENASPVLHTAPAVAFAETVLCAALVPSFALGMVFAPLADLLVIGSLLAGSRIVLGLGAMDVGSARGGVAAARCMRQAIIGEGALFLVIFALALLAGTFNLDTVLRLRDEAAVPPNAAFTLTVVALLAMLLVEAVNHSPEDQELSGLPLAIVQATRALRLVVWLNLVAALLLPVGMASPGSNLLAWAIGLLCWAAKLAVLAALLAAVRVTLGGGLARFRPNILAMAVALGLLAAALALGSAGAA